MGTTWILAANASRARLFEVVPHADTPREIADFSNAAGRAHERDLQSDASGRLYGKGEHVQGHATVEGSIAEHETDRFAESLRDQLARDHAQHKFGQLWIVAAPAFLGLLRKNLPPGLAPAVEFTLDKDYTAESPRELFRRVVEAREAQLRRDAPPADTRDATTDLRHNA
jgi:protein required for attachment to host cells